MKLPCMQTDCKERYTLDEIQQFCSGKVTKQYNVIKEDVRVGKSNKLKWCARPGCELTIRKPGCCCKRRAICACGFETCWKCGDPMHEAACQVSGEAGLLLHNMNPAVSKCPACKTPIYKTDGCNHMTCYRCSAEWCWICHQVCEYPAHFSPGSIFGCSGMRDMPQSILLWILLLIMQLAGTPFIVLGNICYSVGKLLRHTMRGNDESIVGIVFWMSFFGLPLVLIPTAICIPIVMIYRSYIIVTMILRNFFFCCCC